MTEVDHQQEVELFPPKESLQAVELSPRYVPNFNQDISYWKQLWLLIKVDKFPFFVHFCTLVHLRPRVRTLAV
jgi:hypothetical protein